MKKLLILFFLLTISMLANASTTVSSLIGNYSAQGNGGFLTYKFSLNNDGSSEFEQNTGDGPNIECQGVYYLDTAQCLTTVYNCPAGDVFTQELSLTGISLKDLQNGVNLNVHIKSSLGTDSTVLMAIKKIN